MGRGTAAGTETINGKEIAVESHGQGAEAVVMVHGLGGTSNTFTAQVGVLARTFTVIRPDLEGSGRSPLTGKLTVEGFAKDILALMKARHIAAAHLVGHSMGSIVCQLIAARSPAKVKSMVLLGPIAEPPDPARQAMRDRAKLARSEGMVSIADTLLQVAISAATRAHRPAVAAFVREILMRQPAEGYAATCEALAAARAAPLASIKCPTLLITGDEDGVAPPAAVQKIGQAIKGSRVQILAECGHWTPVECAAEVSAAMLNFYFG
ncbi:MAG: alpha/beta fold hydrolase [Alphaproteobacteria bacterium]|nr:alpha/beta fold hydrolase [Alphaproteobacteria bacterium]